MSRNWILFTAAFFCGVLGVYVIFIKDVYAVISQCGGPCGSPTRVCATGLICGPANKCRKPACPVNDPCCATGAVDITQAPATGVPAQTGAPAPTADQSQYQCSMCETNGDGVIDMIDLDALKQKLLQNPGDVNLSNLIPYCQSHCMSVRPTIENQPTVGNGNAIGDCSGPQGGGMKDGRTDLYDFEQLRIEFGDKTETLHCDFDNSGDVDIFDFTDYLRKGIAGS